MPLFALCLGVLAVGCLGLSAGALLAEACVLVPIWRSQRAESFLEWYAKHASLLLGFFGPLEAASAGLIVAATALAWLGHLSGRSLFTASAVLTLAVLASFPLYFKNANASFAAGSVPIPKLAAELGRWAAWHWARTSLAIVAFLLAVLALAQRRWM